MCCSYSKPGNQIQIACKYYKWIISGFKIQVGHLPHITGLSPPDIPVTFAWRFRNIWHQIQFACSETLELEDWLMTISKYTQSSCVQLWPLTPSFVLLTNRTAGNDDVELSQHLSNTVSTQTLHYKLCRDRTAGLLVVHCTILYIVQVFCRTTFFPYIR